MIALLFLCALALSGAAAFYSIAGLMAIFAAAPIPIAIMGTTLEVTKLVVASWLYRNWTPIPKLMKGYLTFALVVLMFLTSMGIFGFLSKAHLDQGVPTGDVAAQVALLDEKIKTEKENINAARATLNQLDQQVNQTLARTSSATDDSAVSRSVAIRRSQARERMALSNEIESAQKRIAKLNEERAPIAAELRKVEAEVGPIKYIAALVYGDEATQDQTILEKAVRWVTILIVSVFDPLAVVLLIAANWSLMHRDKKVVTEPVSEENPPPPEEKVEEPPVTDNLSIFDKHPYLTKPFAHFKSLKPMVAQREQPEVAPQTPPPTDQSAEHPVFVPEGDFWHARYENTVDKKQKL